MFSSLASFIFGSNTTANSEANQPEEQQQAQVQQQQQLLGEGGIDPENTFEVTASTPSVTGAGSNNRVLQGGKRGRNKRGRKHNKSQLGGVQQKQKLTTSPPSITKLLTPSDSLDEDFDDEDWFIVEKEDDEEDSLPRTDSEEESSQVEVKAKNPAPAVAAPIARRRQHSHSHSLYSGPRPQQQRNLLQRARNSGARIGGSSLTVSTLNPPRINAAAAAAAADGGITQSLYVVSPNRNGELGGKRKGEGKSRKGANKSIMEESWYVTPPPCFTSIGPINMESSPFENLLIEHPSMSVYHSIRSAQEATESFINLDLGMEESQEKQIKESNASRPVESNTQAVAQRQSTDRIKSYSAARVKQQMFESSVQKSHDKKDNQKLCRGAIKRANKVRDFQSRGNRQRRSDMQHSKVVSGANNNRKCNNL